jgi:hypothetical protein
MRGYEGRVAEIQMDETGAASAWIKCPQAAVPSPGQYTLAVPEDQENLVLPAVLFPEKIKTDGFRVILSSIYQWMPGRSLRLRGPLGKGFNLHKDARKVALAGLDGSISRLRVLSDKALAQGCAVTLFADCDFSGLPASLEAYPLSALGEALGWADYTAAELPLEMLPEARRLLGLENGMAASLVEVLLVTPVPCGGMGECGVCALKTRHGWKLACQDGPVFNLKELDI